MRLAPAVLKKVFSLHREAPVRTAIRYLRRRYFRRDRTRMARVRRDRSDGVHIAVTGSSGKTTTSALLAHILAGCGSVHEQVVSNTIGPLTSALLSKTAEADHVVLEVGVGQKGDMAPMAAMIRPDVAIVTLVGLEHFSAFRTREAVALEKGALVEAVRPGGLVLLNADDDLVMAMAARTSQRIVTFGREKHADYRVVSATAAYPDCLRVTIVWKGGELTLQTRFPAEHFWLSTVAAAAAALELGAPPETVVDRVAGFEGVANRCRPFPTKEGPCFIVDAAKAPYGTLDLAFTMMEAARAPRKRIVLGHISDYAGDPRPKYRDAYKGARAVADEVIFVGDNAHRSRASQEDRDSGRFFEFATARDVFDHLRKTAQKDELILLKGSRNLHLERIALAWDGDVKCWESICGVRTDCFRCGLYEHPFAEHENIRSERARQRRRERLKFWKRLARHHLG